MKKQRITYKNVSKSDIVLIGFGVIKSGEVVEAELEINNPNLKRVEKSRNMIGVDPVTKG